MIFTNMIFFKIIYFKGNFEYPEFFSLTYKNNLEVFSHSTNINFEMHIISYVICNVIIMLLKLACILCITFCVKMCLLHFFRIVVQKMYLFQTYNDMTFIIYHRYDFYYFQFRYEEGD